MVTAKMVNTDKDTSTFTLLLNEGRYLCDIEVKLLRVEDTEKGYVNFYDPIVDHCNTGALPATTH